MEPIVLWLQENLGLAPETQTDILATILTILAIWIVHQITLRTIIYRIKDLRLRYQWQKAIGYIGFLLGFLLIWPIWFQGQGLRSLATYLGLLSAGLAVALKDPITDMIGFGFILWRKNFEVGDRIQIEDYMGDVIDIRIFQFTLMEVGNWVHADQSTGRILHVPNGKVFTSVLANFTKGSEFIWNEIPVLVTFESNWQRAKDLLVDIARVNSEKLSDGAEESFRQATRQYMIQYGALSSTVYTSVEDSGVLLTIRYLCRPRNRRNSAQEIWEDILHAFARYDDIDFAYPTTRFYNNLREGKQAQAKKNPQEGEI